MNKKIDHADVEENNFKQFANDEGSQQLPQAELRKEDIADQRMEEISGRLERSLTEAEKKGTALQRDGESRIALDYAKENNLWIPDIYSLGNPFSQGNENTNAVNVKECFVFKSNNLTNSQTISNLLEQVKVHNQLFPETKYDFVGFTGIDNGDSRPPFIEVVFRQDLVDHTEPATSEEIDAFMAACGFEKTGRGAYSNGQHIVSDLFPRNVLKDENGEIYVIDDIIKPAGGKTMQTEAYTTPQVESQVNPGKDQINGSQISPKN